MKNANLADPDFIEILEKTSTMEWNEAIASRLHPVRAYLNQDEWKKGVSVYLRAVVGNALKKFMRDGKEPEYLRGFSTAILLVLALPKSVEAQIALEEQNARMKNSGSQPDE